MQIEDLMPNPLVQLRHERLIQASPDRVWPAAKAMTIRKLPLMKVLLFLREWPSRLLGLPLETFPVVREEPGREIVRGICGRLWAFAGNIDDTPLLAIPIYQRAGSAKAYWNFHVKDLGNGYTLLTTETRVVAFGPSAERKMLRYWRLVQPLIGISRTAMLRDIERQSRL